MPRKSKKKIDLSIPKNNEPDDLRVFIAEAEQVDLLTRQQGWEIISRDISEYRESIGCRLAYINPKTKEYEDARILYIASDKLIKLISDSLSILFL